MTDAKMVFTDGNLLEFKKALDCDGSCGGNVYLPHAQYRALLARLAAAEACKESLLDLLHHGLQYENGEIHQADTALARQRIEAWLRTCGKSV